jgi:hypothetical protein
VHKIIIINKKQKEKSKKEKKIQFVSGGNITFRTNSDTKRFPCEQAK